MEGPADLNHILKGLLPSKVYDDVVGQQELDVDKLKSLVEQTIQKHAALLTETIKSKLLLLVELVNELNLPPNLCSEVILHSHYLDIQAVITHFWAIWSGNPERRADAIRMFEAKPAIIIKNLVAQDHFGLSPTVQQDVIQIFANLGPAFNILKDPLPPNHKAIAWLDKLEDPRRKQAALAFVASVQQLCRVIIEPMDLPALISLGFSSVEETAYTPLETFEVLVAPYGISLDHARRIHGEATSAQMRMEQSMMALLQSSNDFPPSKLYGKINASNKSDTSDTRDTNLSKWFGDLDQVGCEDCCSVTSPAAYLVDLFRMLKNLRIQSTSKTTILEKLFERRPDLGDLLLSCRNTSELVPYIDLVNETLESAIIYLEANDGLDSLQIQVYNADSHNHIQEAAQFPHDASNTRYEVYDKFIINKVHPSTVFPYDHSKDSLQNYLKASSTTSAELLEAFRADPRLARDSTLTRLLSDKGAVDTVYSRVYAAEVLGMAQDDYLAITLESFYDLRSARLVENNANISQELYQKNAGLLPSWYYWGYEDKNPEEGDGEETIIDAENGDGLPFIKTQLLPRLDIQFSTLAQILNTRFLDGCLTVSLVPEGAEFNPQRNVPSELDEFRLRGKDGESLDVYSCQRLDQFVRIWRRLGWPIEDVDDALFVFGDFVTSDEGFGGKMLTITPDTIEQLAAISEISRLTKSKPPVIVSLFSQSSQYFLRLPIIQTIRLQGDQTISVEEKKLPAEQYLPLLLSSLNISYDDFVQFQDQEQLGDELSMVAVFKHNRLAEAARMFSVDAEQISKLLAIFSKQNPSLSTPKTFLKALKTWRLLQEDGWEASNLISVSMRLGVQVNEAVDTSTTKLIGAFMGSIKSAEKVLSLNQPQNSSNSPSTESPVPTQSSTAVVDQSIFNAISSFFSKTPTEIIKTLLKKSFPDGRPTLNSQILSATTKSPGVDYEAVNFTGALFFAEDVIIHVETALKTETDTSFSVGETTYVLTKNVNGDRNSSLYECNIGVSAGTAVYLSWPSNFSNTQITLQNPDGTPFAATEVHPISTNVVLEVQHAIGQIGQYGLLVEHYPVNASELEVLLDSGINYQGFDIVNDLHSYILARRALMKTGKEVDFARFTQRFLGYQVPSSDLVLQFSQVTVLSKSMAEKLLMNNLSEGGARSSDLRLEALRKIGQQFQLMARMGLGEDSLELLFTCAEPPPFGTKKDSTDRSQRPVTRLVQRLQAALAKRGMKNTLKNAQNVLRENRRKALIQYLLQNDDIKYNKGVTDADGLFHLFLIDVQMGSSLETTRIKQAISTVQFFVHRCLLGLEEDIDGTLIPQDRWAWMSRYNLWEANRKVFLYPENWADPALRDSKTLLFCALEDDIMKSNLDERSITNIIRTYICSMDDIANLQVQSFYWDKSHDPKIKETGVFHIVSRTRNAPYQYYYRQLEYLAKGSLPAPLWSPWEKLPFDVRAHDVDHDGKALAHTGSYVVPAFWQNRLIIFLPRISVIAVPNDKPSTTVTLSSRGSSSDSEQEIKVGGGGGSSDAQLRLEIKMAWSERVDGVWVAQKQSQDTLTAPSGRTPPTFDSFRFSIYQTDENLSVLLYQADSSSEPNYLGQFRLHGPRLSFISGDGKRLYTESNAPRTLFGQLRVDSGEYYKADNWSSISQPPVESSRLSTVSWVLDSRSDSTQPLGLVADLSVKDGRGHEPWFTLPTALFGNSKKGNDTYAYQLFNPLSDKLRAAVTNDDGVDAIYRVMDKSTISSRIVSPEDQNMNHAFGSTNQLMLCREDATPYSIYNWEIGFHLVALLVERLIGLQAFDLAIKYAHLVFDPTGADGPKPTHPTWRFPPFRDDATLEYGKLGAIIDKLRPSSGDEDHMFAPILAWRRNPFNPHTVARGRPLSYMKRFAIKYMEALISSGDVYFRQNSLETIHFAIERYIEASHVFGPRPQTVPKLGKQQFKSYNDLSSQLDDFSNASVKLELSSPYYVPLQERGTSEGNGSGALQSFLLTPYFGVQANPEFMELRSKIDKRLYQIRNSLDINGNPRTLSLYDPPVDVGDLVTAFASGSQSDIASVISGFPKVMPRQRFMYLIQKAYELCSELKTTSATLLSAIEKGDVEALQLLHSNQDTGMQRILMEIKLKQKAEAQAGLDQLIESRRSAVVRFKYYAALTGDKVPLPTTSTDFEEVQQNIPVPIDQDLRLSQHEKLELAFADSSSSLNSSAALLDEIAAAFLCVPMPALNGQPMGMGVTIQIPNPGQFMQIGATIMRANALEAAEDSQRASRIAMWTRQLQERRLQLNLAGRDIKNIDKQMEVQTARIAVIDKDIESQKQTAENLLKIQDFLCTKFSNKELYSWYESTTRNYLYQTYLVTMELVRKAEIAYLFEQGPNARSTLSNKGYWDQGKRGLQCGEQLWFALKQMELSYLNEVRHDFEITKSISLRQLDPVALLNLRELGETKFDLPEVLFDLDFPGHYFRRIKSVSLSFPCITGPYVGINCTVTLLQHQYRASDSTDPSYLATERDTRFAHEEIQTPIRSVCISSGNNDAGVFEPLDFHGDRYQPFEGAGVISSWSLRLPKEYRAFDYRTISDVVMQIRYTAKNGGETLARAASIGNRDIMEGAAKASQKKPMSLLLDVRSDYADAWYSCTAAPDRAHKDRRVMSIPNIKSRLPFLARGRKVTIKSATVYVTGPDLSKYRFYISKTKDRPDTGAVLGYDDKLGDLQLFSSPENGSGLDAMCSNDNNSPPWYLTMATTDGGDAGLVPTNMLLVVDYALSS
ncbi:uncharacterized protein TRIVIDRAFT_61595 [Trichoderma virens Gv29-8]|uniref:Uncharacterized protein n=1 Tax=Hypocrea virens (strain Gv29-8 / FGSC 10586) TaxID=413071 RepID=G9MKT9_HYPVG|nr:uncharacterized protein TRIVIDRAFT_61595 [Trichoderma virens Gv29-8]EHK24835.1 hypothetical protein TRIVIDRAFT_61595 [Trichoderma virens Gv29-8]